MSENIKVLHVIWSLHHGGAEAVLSQLTSLTSRAYEHCVVCLEGVADDARQVNLPSEVCVRVPAEPLTTWISKIKWIRGEIKALKPKILCTYNWTGTDGILASIGIRGLARVHAEHGFEHDEATRLKWRRNLARCFLLKLCRAVICVSNSMNEIAKNQWAVSEEKRELIRNGIDTGKFSPGQKSISREDLGLSKDDIVLGFVGRIARVKNLEFLVREFVRLQGRSPSLRLVIVGEGPTLDDLKQLAEREGVIDRISFMGARQDPENIYPLMDCFCMTSMTEQCPMVIAEAMACGLPVVSLDRGDIKGMVAEENKRFIARDDNEFHEKLVQMINQGEKRKEIGLANRRKAEREMDVQKMIDQYRDVYEWVQS